MFNRILFVLLDGQGSGALGLLIILPYGFTVLIQPTFAVSSFSCDHPEVCMFISHWGLRQTANPLTLWFVFLFRFVGYLFLSFFVDYFLLLPDLYGSLLKALAMDVLFRNVRQRNSFLTATRVELLSLLADRCDRYFTFQDGCVSFFYFVSLFTEQTTFLAVGCVEVESQRQA